MHIHNEDCSPSSCQIRAMEDAALDEARRAEALKHAPVTDEEIAIRAAARAIFDATYGPSSNDGWSGQKPEIQQHYVDIAEAAVKAYNHAKQPIVSDGELHTMVHGDDDVGYQGVPKH